MPRKPEENRDLPVDVPRLQCEEAELCSGSSSGRLDEQQRCRSNHYVWPGHDSVLTERGGWDGVLTEMKASEASVQEGLDVS